MSTRTNGKKKGLSFGKIVEPYLYLAPFAIGVLVFTLYPIVNVVLLSFKEGYNFISRFNKRDDSTEIINHNISNIFNS